MHLFGDPDLRLLGVNTDESFNAVLEHANLNHPNPDMLCITGDISQDETLHAYERFAEKISPMHCPKYWVPGNHDDTEYISRVFPEFHIQSQKHMVLDHWQIIMLDTKKLNAVEGYINDDQLILLDEALASHPEHHALIFMHHHPLPIGSHWLDNLMLINASEFWDTIGVYKNVKVVICGHVHQEHHSTYDNIQFYSTPSTCFQFKRDSTKFAIENLAPGYRTIELFQDGTYDTTVHRIENFELTIDGTLTGY
jgi:Icc protein